MAIKTRARSHSCKNGPRSVVKAAVIQETGASAIELNERTRFPSLPRDGALEADRPPGLSLRNLTDLTRTEQYQSRRCRQIQQHLYLANITAARTARLTLAARSIQRTLAECIKSEDKHSFVNLFNAFHDALSDCPTSPSMLDRDGSPEDAYPPSFLDALPVTSQAPVLDFITKVKTDGAFISDRLATLSHKELMGLLPDKGLSRTDDSIFGSPQRTSSRTSRHLGYVVDAQTELLSSHDLASPLDVLIHSTRGLSDVSLQDDDVATHVWATVCSRFIADQRPGSEKLVPAVIDAWASSSTWPGKERLEFWLLHTLQRGSFILEQPRRQTFAVTVQARPAPPAEEHVRRESFYADAADSLLRLLVDSEGASIIPSGALAMCRAIYTNLQHSPAHQRAFPNFAITRWLFPSFLLDAIILPEAHGILTDYFVPDHARQSILREVASRCYKTVFDVVYSWKLGNAQSDQATHLVRALAERFCDPVGTLSAPLGDSVGPPEDLCIVAISASDIQTVVNALYPAPALPSLSDRDSTCSGLRSSASSVSGFSLFQVPAPLDTLASGLQGSPRALYADPLPSGQPASPSDDPLTASYSTLHADSEGEQLREICTAIDDILSRTKSSAPDHWSVLVSHGAGHRLSTVHSRQHSFLDPPDAETLVEHTQPLQKSCQSTITDLLVSGDLLCQHEPSMDSNMPIGYLEATIVQALRRRIAGLEESMDLVQAHSYHRKLRQIREMVTKSTSTNPLASVMDLITLGKHRSLNNALSIVQSCDALFRSVRTCLDRHSSQLLHRMENLRRLRDKMWYIADVRTCASYDGLRSVVSALKTMGKAQKPPRTRLVPPSRAVNGSKVPITNYHLKSETQILDLLTAPAGYGGRNKFGDDQSKTLATWMENYAIENLCRGEERIHKLVMEIQRVTELATSENSTLIASDLFARDQPRPLEARSATGYPGLRKNGGGFDLLSLCTDMPLSIDAMSSASSHARSSASSRDYLNHWSPSTTHRSSVSVWSPVMTEARSPSSVTSMESSQTESAAPFSTKLYAGNVQSDGPSPHEALRQHTTSLLLSDIANPLFMDGSETDRAFWTGLGGELAVKYFGTLAVQAFPKRDATDESLDFNFEDAFKKLTRRFSASCNPYVKLRILLDMDTLLEPYMSSAPSSPLYMPAHVSAEKLVKNSGTPKLADVKVEGFRRLFCNEATRPVSIFRDLQYIAALVPSRMLETSSQGKAFWNAAVAISGLKRGICKVMVETADSIIAHHSNKRGHGRSSSVAQRERDSAAFSVPNRSPSPEDVSGRTMSDAALLLQITAREGDAVAQRELATLYLTHPELMDHILAPLARPRDVFKEELESKWRKNQDPTRCDPTTMCVAHHWMSLSSKGGDALAMEFLRQREEMERLP